MTTTAENDSHTPARLTPAQLATYGANLTTRTGLDPNTTRQVVEQLQNDSLAHAINATGYVLQAADEALQQRWDQLIATIQSLPATMRMVSRDRVIDAIRRARPAPLPKNGR